MNINRFRSRQGQQTNRNYPKMIFTVFIVFCIGVLVWDIGRNGWPAGMDELPATAGLDAAGEPDKDSAPAEQTDSSDQLSPEQETAAAFAQLRLEREEARGEELALLERIISDKHTSTAALADAEERRIAIAADMENEITAESLLAAKGYGETVVMIGAEQTTVIVDLEIDAQDAAVIAEIVDKASGCGFANVVIVKRSLI